MLLSCNYQEKLLENSIKIFYLFLAAMSLMILTKHKLKSIKCKWWNFLAVTLLKWYHNYGGRVTDDWDPLMYPHQF